MADDPETKRGAVAGGKPPAMPADAATGAFSELPLGAPPTMPTAAAPGVPASGPPPMPVDEPPPAAKPALYPPGYGPDDDGPLGTMQLPMIKAKTGQTPLSAIQKAAPIMATLRSDKHEPGASDGSTGPTPAPVFGKPPEMPDERYELGSEIARGGMGRVVEAMDTLLGRTVALKEALTTDAENLRRFARETRITAKLEHPSIVPVHDAGTLFGGVPFYVMRKVSGRPLEHLVARAEKLEDRLALVPHMLATAHAIAHAHERGIVHRDIKPSNILVGDNGETIVIDWGLAKVIGEEDEPVPMLSVGSHGSRVLAPLRGKTGDHNARALPGDAGDIIKTRAGIVYGTPGFMAPEQLRGAPVNEKVDVYALGATLYHLLSRKPPHHAKTADEMMQAAVHGPPTPIAELVPGVPPELSTIVEKALAHDAAVRYPDAHAVAEDLQRFLTGQLVASHHYSRQERLRRFIKKHRTPVLIASAATLAMIIFGTIAVTRVVIARDRADAAAKVAVAQRQVAEEQRARAEERAEALTLAQAKNDVATNPTRAIAMMKPLVGKRPDEVRAVATAARASGVAWSLPASKKTATVEMSRDGRRVLAAGDDGVVRLYHLDTRTTKTIVQAGDTVSARFASDENQVVLWRGPKLVVVDIASGKRDERPVTTPIVDLEIVGDTAFWIDDKGTLWNYPLAGGAAPAEIPLDERATQLTPSPDGKWIALYGEYHLLLHDRSRPTETARIVADGKTLDVDWSADGSSLAALVERDAGTTSVLQIEMHPEPLIVHRLSVGNRRYIVFSNDRMYTIGPTGVGVVSRNEESGVRKQVVGSPVGLRETRDHGIVAGSQGSIAILTDRGDLQLAPPSGHIDIVEASPASPYVVAMIEERMLVWNLDDVQPRLLAKEPPLFAGFVGSSHVLAAFPDRPTQLIEIDTGKAIDAGQATEMIQMSSAPSGKLAAMLDTSHRVWLAGPSRAPEQLAVTADVIGLPSDRELAIGNANGTVSLYDVQTKQVTQLTKRAAHLEELVWTRKLGNLTGGSPWLAARFDDKTLWRKQLGGGPEQTVTLPIDPTSTILVAPDGTVLYADSRSIRAWRLDGTLDEHASLPKPITRLGMVGSDRAIAFTQDGAAQLIDLAARHQTQESIVVGPLEAAMAVDSGLMIVPDRGGVDVIDPITRHRWKLTAPPGGALEGQQSRRAASFEKLRVTADGRRVMAQTPNGLFVWTLPSPESRTALAGWIDSLTNAVIDPGGGIAWR